MTIGDLDIRLVDILLTGTFALLVWCARELRALQFEISKLRMILTGEQGDNGLKGQVEQHDECIHEYGVEIGKQGERLLAAERDIKELKASA